MSGSYAGEQTGKREETRTKASAAPSAKSHLIGEKELKKFNSHLARDIWTAVLFLLCIPFLECVLRLGDASTVFLGPGLWRSLLAGLAAGALLWFLSLLIGNTLASRTVTAVLLFFLSAVFIAQRCCRTFFGSYFELGFMTDMTGQVAGDFLTTALSVMAKNWWFFLFALAPPVLFLVFRKKLVPNRTRGHLRRVWPELVVAAVLLVLFQTGNVLLCHTGDDSNYYTVDFSANSAIPRFGVINALRLEGQYALFGQPELELVYEPLEEEPAPEEERLEEEPAEQEEEPVTPEEPEGEAPEEEDLPAEEEESQETETVYGDNLLDIDYDALLAGDTSGELQAMDLYFSSTEPTAQNEYTGLFAGKNLIFLTAEAFSGAILDEERTPALWYLSHNGFVFSNYYQPGWGQSTTGGEFAAMTGLVPTWLGSKTSFYASAGNSMPFALGWQMRELGYDVTAYHANTYTYYHRDETHPNLGYDFIAIGNGLELPSQDVWPPSDLELLQATIEDKIQAYLEDGTLFHTYYMTISGHANYSFAGNGMSAKNRDAVADLTGSEEVRAYVACQMELEYALEYLLQTLYDAGIAEDTVIVLTPDHYPYALAEGDTDYYNELTGGNDSEDLTSRYRNTLILWCGEMEEPVEVDLACSALDILPTLSNLFGLRYDSRLLSGRDILAPDTPAGQVSTAMHLVPFPDRGYGISWITAAGTYEAYTNTFTPNEGVEVGADYVSQVSKLAQDRITYAKYVVAEDYYAHVLPEGIPAE